MSKQSEAKTSQQYVSKALPAVCGTCVHLLCDRVDVNKAYLSAYVKPAYQDKNLRCGIGRFAVKKMGTCNRFELRKHDPAATCESKAS